MSQLISFDDYLIITKIIVKMPTIIYIIIYSFLFLIDSIPLAPAPGLYLDRVGFGELFDPAMAPGSANLKTLTWRYALPSIHKVAMFVHAFNSLDSYSVLSYHAYFQSCTLTDGVILFSPRGTSSDINFIAFSVMILTYDLAYLDLVMLSSQSVSTQLASVPPMYKAHYTMTTKFAFTPSKLIHVNLLISYLQLSNPPTTNEEADFFWQTVPSTSTINITLSTLGNNYLKGFKICLVIIDNHAIAPNIAVNASMLYFSDLAPYYFNLNFGIDTVIFDNVIFQYNCMFGFGGSYFQFKMEPNPKSFFFGVSGSGLDIDSVFRGSVTIGLLTFCLASCPESMFVSLPTYLCRYCKDYMPHCGSCYTSTDCIACFSQLYYLSADSKVCNLCSYSIQYCANCSNSYTCLSCYIGALVVGGCANMIGCVQVSQLAMVGGAVSICVACDNSQFILDPVSYICKCKEGSWLAGSHCTNIVGCITARKVANTVLCIFCNADLKFIFDSSTKTCRCVDGFQFQDGICLQKCGDGWVIASECDDGNLDGGDGCSSTCTVEIFHRCTVNSSGPSVCQYWGQIYSISLTETQKVVDKNQGVFTFTIEPRLPLLSKFNISNYFKFQCDSASFQVLSWTYSNGTITLFVDFQSDLETNSASVNFAFDQLYVRHPDVLLNFTVASNGTMLIIFEPSDSVTAIRYVLLATASAAVFLLLVGSCLQKMVGVEVIATIQIVYFSHFALKDYSPTLTVFQELSILGFSDLLLQKACLNVRLTDDYQRVPFSGEKSEMDLIILSALLLSLVCLFFALRTVVFFGKTDQNFPRSFYQCLMVPIVLSLEIPFFLIVFTLQSTTVSASLVPKKVQTSILYFSFATVALVSFGYIKKVLTGQSRSSGRNANPKQSYIPAFQLYLLLQTFALFLWLQQGIPLCIFAMLFLEVLFLVWYLAARPYDSGFDNLGAMASILPLMVFQGLWLLRQKGVFASTPQNDVLACIVVGGLLGVCTLFSLARMAKAATAKIMKKCKDQPIHPLQAKLKKTTKQAKDALLEQEQLQSRLRQNIPNPSEKLNLFMPSSKQNCIELKSDKSSRDEPLTTMIKEKKKDFRAKRDQLKLERQLIQSIERGAQI